MRGRCFELTPEVGKPRRIPIFAAMSVPAIAKRSQTTIRLEHPRGGAQAVRV